jgi:hypothetical protein
MTELTFNQKYKNSQPVNFACELHNQFDDFFIILLILGGLPAVRNKRTKNEISKFPVL